MCFSLTADSTLLTAFPMASTFDKNRLAYNKSALSSTDGSGPLYLKLIGCKQELIFLKGS